MRHAFYSESEIRYLKRWKIRCDIFVHAEVIYVVWAVKISGKIYTAAAGIVVKWAVSALIWHWCIIKILLNWIVEKLSYLVSYLLFETLIIRFKKIEAILSIISPACILLSEVDETAS